MYTPIHAGTFLFDFVTNTRSESQKDSEQNVYDVQHLSGTQKSNRMHQSSTSFSVTEYIVRTRVKRAERGKRREGKG